jgi:hypothetical protein
VVGFGALDWLRADQLCPQQRKYGVGSGLIEAHRGAAADCAAGSGVQDYCEAGATSSPAITIAGLVLVESSHRGVRGVLLSGAIPRGA